MIFEADYAGHLGNRISAAVLRRLRDSNLGWLLPAGPLIKAILLFLKDNWREDLEQPSRSVIRERRPE